MWRASMNSGTIAAFGRIIAPVTSTTARKFPTATGPPAPEMARRYAVAETHPLLPGRCLVQPLTRRDENAVKTSKPPHYEVGMIVEHPKRPEWGPGKIVALSADRIHVVFRDALERKAKVMMRSLVSLDAAEAQSDALLDRLPPAKQDGSDWLLPANYDRLLRKAMSTA